MKNNQLPNSLEAEQSFLGSLIAYSNKTLDIVSNYNITPQDFYYAQHVTIMKRIIELRDRNQTVDMVSLLASLEANNELQQIGGIEYLSILIENAGMQHTTINRAEIILNKAKRRELIYKLNTAIEKTYDESSEILNLLNDVEKDVLVTTRSHATSDFKSSAMVAAEVLDQIYALKKGHGVTGVKVNYPAIDHVTNGFQRGDLIILAARPSMGKTAFALNLGLRASKINQQKIAMFSLEMGADALMKRLLSAEGGIEANKMRTGAFDDKELNLLNQTVNKMNKLNIFIDETAGITMNEIFAKCRKLKTDVGIDMIIIDYLQLITTKNSRSENRVQEVSQISRELKMLARELDCPVIALSQLSRAVENRPDKRPMLADLRESGSIEQDADLVMFLYRDEYYNKDESKDPRSPDITEINIAKHRNGLTTTVKLAFEKYCSRFTSISKESN